VLEHVSTGLTELSDPLRNTYATGTFWRVYESAGWIGQTTLTQRIKINSVDDFDLITTIIGVD